jgi:hypothetical protein
MSLSKRESGNILGHWSDQPTRSLGVIVLWVTAIMLTAIGIMQMPGLHG